MHRRSANETGAINPLRTRVFTSWHVGACLSLNTVRNALRALYREKHRVEQLISSMEKEGESRRIPHKCPLKRSGVC